MSSEPSDTSKERRISVLVITVSYKTAALVCKSLQALAREREQHPEVDLRAFVVDNASGDAPGIAACIETHGYSAWATLQAAAQNGGFSYGNNLGFQFAYQSGSPPDYLLLLNPDAEVLPGAVSELVNFMEAHPRAAVAGSLLLYPDGRPWPIAFRFPSIWSEIDEGVNWGLVTKLLDRWVVSRKMGDQPERVDWLPGASMMIRRRVIDELGGLDESYFLYFEEVDFMLKLARAGWETWFVPQSRVYHIAGVSSGITGEEREHRPLPDYWFESRRRFFAKNHGVPYAVATDLVAVTARLLGQAKRALQRSPGTPIPGYVSGLVRNSVVFGKNQRVAKSIEFWPNGSVGKPSRG